MILDERITHLDIGGTYICDEDACGEYTSEQSPQYKKWVVITLNDLDESPGFNSKGKVIADCVRMPFEDNFFKHIHALCFLEFDENIDYHSGGISFDDPTYFDRVAPYFKEVYRVLKPGAGILVSQCGGGSIIGDENNRRDIDEILQTYAKLAIAAGFVVDQFKWKTITADWDAEQWRTPPLKMIKPRTI